MTQFLFDLIFWILIIPVFYNMNHVILKSVIIGIGLVHFFYNDPWPRWSEILAYFAAYILIIFGYRYKCNLAIIIGVLMFIGHYLKDSGIISYYYWPSK